MKLKLNKTILCEIIKDKQLKYVTSIHDIQICNVYTQYPQIEIRYEVFVNTKEVVAYRNTIFITYNEYKQYERSYKINKITNE